MAEQVTTVRGQTLTSILDESRLAARAGAYSAAYLRAWGAIEAILQQLTGLEDEVPAAVMISYARNRGFFKQPEYDALRSAFQARNAVVHGGRKTSANEVDALILLADQLISSNHRGGESVATPIREIVGGEPYEYFPLGEYVVRAPGVCGGRPTFKYTRIEAEGALQRLASGESFDKIARGYGERVPAAALQEAIDIRARPLLNEFELAVVA